MSGRLAGLLALFALLFAIVLGLVSSTTRIAGPDAASGDPEPALEAAAGVLGPLLHAAGSGLPSGVPAAERLEAEVPVTDETGAPVRRRAGADALLLRGVLSSPLVALDPEDRGTGRPYAGRGGTLAASPALARLAVPVYPLAFNPRRLWVAAPAGLGWTFAAKDASGARRNEPLEAVLAALARRPAAARRFVVADASGRASVARVVRADGGALAAGCSCVAPAPWPGDCPPGRAGCRLELLLDFTAESRASGFLPPERLGPLVSGGLLDEMLFCVIDAPRPWLARGEADGTGRFALTRIGEGIDTITVHLPDGSDPALRVEVGGPGGPGGPGGAAARRSAAVSAPLPRA